MRKNGANIFALHGASEQLTTQNMKKLLSCWLWIFVLISLTIICPTFTPPAAYSQDIRRVGKVRESGTIRAIKPGLVSIINEQGDVVTCKIQDKDERAISVSGIAMNIPAKILVRGALPTQLVEKGMVVQFEGRTSQYGKSDGEVPQITVLNDSSSQLKVDFLERPEPGEAGRCDVVGRVINLTKQKLQLQVPKSKWAKKKRIIFKLAEGSTMLFSDDDLNRVIPGDEVANLEIQKLSTGEMYATKIEIRLTATREQFTTSFHEKLEQEFSSLSDDPAEPRELTSQHFLLYTDVSERNGQILLAKLESMHQLIGGYFGKRPRVPIECYVIADIRKWRGHQLDPRGVKKILEPAGVTLVMPNNNALPKVVVYSCDRHSIVQHEAVHAFCALAFESIGPVWYAEGMAELGNNWKPDKKAVNVDSVVIDYLTSSKPKKMADIVAAGQITGDSWQAYAWRWALCHLLANNDNYSRRFKKLGIAMMSGGEDSFERAFGKVAKNISFEYDQFVENFGNGYRVDLCQWDWGVAASNLDGNGRTKTTVSAQAGWQPTKLEVRTGVSYQFVANGDWKLSPKEKFMNAKGRDGRGQLVGAILTEDPMTGFHLSEPIRLSKHGQFSAAETGQLYLRCEDSWTELNDNEGEVLVHLRRTPKKKSVTSKTSEAK